MKPAVVILVLVSLLVSGCKTTIYDFLLIDVDDVKYSNDEYRESVWLSGGVFDSEQQRVGIMYFRLNRILDSHDVRFGQINIGFHKQLVEDFEVDSFSVNEDRVFLILRSTYRLRVEWIFVKIELDRFAEEERIGINSIFEAGTDIHNLTE